MKMTGMWTLTTSSVDGQTLRALDRVEDRIRQHRQVSDGPVLVVEGPDDALLLRDVLTGVDIFPADGKNRAISCSRTLLGWNVGNFVCITDNDFDDPAEYTDLEDVHVPYPLRDLELMLVALGVLEKLLEHHGSADKLAACGGASALVDQIVEVLRPVTSLRFQNARLGWGLAFGKVDIASKADRTDLALKLRNYCAAVVQASESPGVTIEQALNATSIVIDDELGPRGKDVLALAGLALRKRAGNCRHAATTEATMISQLHSSAGLALSKSEWLSDLQERLTLT